MIRRLVGTVLLLALSVLQAVPLAGSLCAATPDCCTGAMCPMRQKTHAGPDHTACSCPARDNHAVGLGVYVLPQPQGLSFALVTSPVMCDSLAIGKAFSSSLDPPPPRTLDA